MTTHFHNADKTLLTMLILTILAVVFVSCGESTKTTKGYESSKKSVAVQGSQEIAAKQQDWGDNWQPIDQRRKPYIKKGNPQGAIPKDTSKTGPTTVWTIILKTFTASNHQIAAARMAAQVELSAPELKAVRVHTTEKGSMVVYGSFDRADSPDTQRALKLVKQTRIQDRVAFPFAMLSRIHTNASSTKHPNNLISVRKQYPKTLLYTLQVAMWGDPDNESLTLEQIRRSAQAYTTKLRAQGYNAYFYHDDDKRLSMVTIGVFNSKVVDHQSGIVSPEVQELLRKFPNHLVNGEILHEPVDRHNMKKGTKPQRPHLVEIPKL